jgi:carboxyl-terminal processing protease
MSLNPPLPSEEPTAEVPVATLVWAATGDPTSPFDPSMDARADDGEATPASAVAPVAGTTPAPRSRVAASRASILFAAVALVAVLAGSAMFFAGFSLGRQSALTPGTPSGDADAFQPFWDTYSAITDRYAGGSVDRKSLVEGAIKGMIGALDDPYSQYLTSEEFRASLQGIAGQFEGIGATIGTVDRAGAIASCTTLSDDCRLAVVAPLTGSPAQKAGLQPGDVIDQIDGSALSGLSVDQARGKVRGPRDTTVTLRIRRGSSAPFDVPIVRAVIVQPEVETDTLAGGKVGYIKLAGFSDRSAGEFDDALKAALGRDERQLIVDLRGNPGGFVTAARAIASEFLADGPIFWQLDADGNLTETAAQGGGVATDPSIQLVLLVDGGSASASEIVAGALHDRGRATLVGTKTFGKGTVQQWTQLEDNSGGFRLTIAKWLTPDKTWIHGKGIVPDVVVTGTPAKPGDDPVLDAGLKVLGDEPDGSEVVRPAA